MTERIEVLIFIFIENFNNQSHLSSFFVRLWFIPRWLDVILFVFNLKFRIHSWFS